MSRAEPFEVELDHRLSPYARTSPSAHARLAPYVARGMPRSVAARLAEVYGPVNAASPRIMAAGLARIEDAALFRELLGNLWEECGEGDPARTHVAMFDVFARGVGVDVARCPLAGRGARLVDDYLDVCRASPEHQVLAMFHGFEAVFPYLCRDVDVALRRGCLAARPVAHFFAFHAVHDLKHASTTRAAMIAAADTATKRRECLWFVERGAGLIHDLFDEALAERPVLALGSADGTGRREES